MNLFLLVLIILYSFALCLFAQTQMIGKRTLVVLDKISTKDSYSKFFNQLKARNHELTFKANQESDIKLQQYGKYQYDNLVLFSPASKSFGGLSESDITDFLDNGGNLLFAASKKLSPALRKFAAYCGVDFANQGSIVMDHINHVEGGTVYNSVIKAKDFVQVSAIVGKDLSKPSNSVKPVFFNGIGNTVSSENYLAFSALRPSSYAYSASPVKDVSDAQDRMGNKISLVTGVQGRNNARMIFSGSLDMFSDDYYVEESSNEKFCDAISQWAFQESGVLRSSNIHHQREDGSRPDRMLSNVDRPDQPVSLYPDAEVARDSLVYRIKDNLTYSFDIQELKNGKWTPFKANDVQLEFVMLDPYVRKTMTHDDKGHFSVTFESPDTYGIFQFRVMYRRLGYSTIYQTNQVSLRPFKHDEYERFIPSAFPYYVSSFALMTGVFIYSFFLLYSSD